MEINEDLILDDYYKLKISPKKLSSGRYRVKFYATIREQQEIYGYLLVESGETLKSVISRIKSRLRKMDHAGEFGFFQLNPNIPAFNQGQMMIFQS